MGSRRFFIVVFIVGLALTLLGGAHLLLARRLIVDPGLQGPMRWIGLTAIALLGLGAILQPALERVLPAPWTRRLSFPFLVWMGLFWIGLNAALALDLVDWLVVRVGLVALAPGAKAAVLAVAMAGLGSIGLWNGLHPPQLRRVIHRLARWPDALSGFRIVQLSDIHIGPVLGESFARKLVARVNALDADLVVITGDLVDGHVERLRSDVEAFADLRARHGVFFVTGNHDMYSGDEAWVARIRELGIRVLRNEHVRIEADGSGFVLAGVDDYRGDWARGSSEDLPKTLDGWQRSQPLVLLAHDPATFRKASHEGIDLQLSGHTHGGQIWPFRWLVRLSVRWVAGCYQEGDSHLYVSRGTGFWGPPMRLLSPAEITEHE
ncbi:MAG: metallophosphoesterase, partial [bacterium]|nr:metallophosphoesterase [bacterium]